MSCFYHVADPDERHDFFTRLPARRKVDAVVVVGFQVDADEQAQLATMGVHIVATEEAERHLSLRAH